MKPLFNPILRSVILIIILLISCFLLFYRLNKLMPFIGDQGWFYLSARDMVLTGNVPLVGITASHTWLHQGPLWTYILAFIFWISNFNPVAPGYFTALLGVFTVYLVYKIGSEFFSNKVGFIASFLYATSPIVIMSDRMPYHTSLISLFTLLFIFFLYKWIKGGAAFFPLSVFCLAILYNLELATSVLWFLFIAVFSFGAWQKAIWFRKILKRKIIFFSLLGFLLPMMPVLIYDAIYGFPQTLKFVIWIFYRIFLVFFAFGKGFYFAEFLTMTLFLWKKYQELIFLSNSCLALLFLVFSFGWFLFVFYQKFRKKTLTLPLILIFLWIFTTLIGFVVNRTPSDAYVPVLFGGVTLLSALFWARLLQFRKISTIVLIIIAFTGMLNAYFLLKNKYFVKPTFQERLWVAEDILRRSKHRDFNLIGKGPGSQFESFTMNYEYLAWWLGNAPSKINQRLKFVISEEDGKVMVTKYEY